MLPKFRAAPHPPRRRPSPLGRPPACPAARSTSPLATTALRGVLPTVPTSPTDPTGPSDPGRPDGPSSHSEPAGHLDHADDEGHSPAFGTVATLPDTPPVPIALSPTLAANEVMAARKLRGEPVLPMAFGEAGLPAHPSLRLALAEATGRTGYGPVAGQAALREAAAGDWQRRGLDTHPGAVVCGA